MKNYFEICTGIFVTLILIIQIMGNQSQKRGNGFLSRMKKLHDNHTSRLLKEFSKIKTQLAIKWSSYTTEACSRQPVTVSLVVGLFQSKRLVFATTDSVASFFGSSGLRVASRKGRSDLLMQPTWHMFCSEVK